MLAAPAKRQRRLWDAYTFPGFRPEGTVRGVFGDRKARIVKLIRRSKKRLLNLVSNAIKFTEQREITVGARLLERTGEHVRLCFRRTPALAEPRSTCALLQHLQPSRRLNDAQVRWHRAWPFDQQEVGRNDGGRVRRRQHVGPRQHVPIHCQTRPTGDPALHARPAGSGRHSRARC